MSKKTETPVEPTETELQTLVESAAAAEPEAPVVNSNPVHVTERRSFARGSADQPVKVTSVTGHNSGV